MIFTFDEPDWTTDGDAIITDIYGSHSPDLALAIKGDGIGLAGGIATHGIDTITPHATYSISAWVNPDANTTQTPLRVRINGGDLFIADINPNSLIFGDWNLVAVGSFVVGGDPPIELFIQIATDNSGLGFPTNGIWLVDDIEITITEGSAADVRKWGAISAAVVVLKTIAGSAFNTNFNARVYTRLFTPAERPEVKLPYACLPLDQEAERIEYEDAGFTSTFRLIGHAFFADDPESDPLDSEGSVQAAKFRDDVIRAFMADQSLGGETLNCEVVAIDTASGVIDDGIAEVMFTIEFTQMAAASDLEAA